MSARGRSSLILILLVSASSFIRAEEPSQFPQPIDTQELTSPLLTPEQALKAWKVPEGYKVSLFAAEPEVNQPIGSAWDPRGRLWVAENYTYAEAKLNFDLRHRDRIVILHDKNGDGRSDSRKVFHDRLQKLTSVEVGFGGVWAIAPPNLVFIPDADGDDKPDAEPEILLDGFDDGPIRHNLANGLRWGPDGWLYGRHGIQAVSYVGKPGTPREERTPVNCGIWRYHPTSKKFETVCYGTTNPWGMDWDQHGELFMINTVIGHLWHAIPGSHFRRMYGEDLNPYTYVQIEQTADHVHWDTSKEDWGALRNKGMSSGTDAAGGGHAHSGLMFYLGDNWPQEMRNEVFTLNFHGRRVNREHVEREGATFSAKHRPDMFPTSDVWFRGLDLTVGPDGGVYVLDWSDIGECHDHDGVHRTSGRVYRMTYGDVKASPIKDVAALSSEQLVRVLYGPSEWYARQARHLLQQRAAKGEDLKAAKAALETMLKDAAEPPLRLRALWALHAIGATTPRQLLALLDDKSENVCVWAIRLLSETQPIAPEAVAKFASLAKQDASGLVLTYLASALQRMEPAQRWAIAEALVAHKQFAYDRVYPHMVWYGIEAAVPLDPKQAVKLLEKSQLPLVNRCLVRRLIEDVEQQGEAFNAIVGLLDAVKNDDQRRAILGGISEGMAGRHKATAPRGWKDAVATIEKTDDAESKRLVQEISVVFGDGRAVDQLIQLTRDGKQTPASRRRAIESLAAARVEGLQGLLIPLLPDRDVGGAAVQGLASSDSPETTKLLIDNYNKMHRLGRTAALEALATRKASATALLKAVSEKKIAANDVSPFLLRQMQLLGDEAIGKQLVELWPSLRFIAADKLALMSQYRDDLTPERLKSADLANGRKLYDQSCAKCHKLFGQGGAIGPELTGAQRSNLNYILENVVDPSATLAANFRMSIVVLNDGRSLNGVVVRQDERTLHLQTPTELKILERKEVDEVTRTNLSLMPEGLLGPLAADQVRDLVGYLMSPQQVRLPGEK